uniref:Uncharacterized protein n=1 Tax=Ditylenchus dipsaci TaxID=166011 RepID=A0A915E7W6_9BILA
MRTKLRIAEKECKRKEKEIGDLLPTLQYEERLQLNSLKKRILQLERALRSKTEENEYLLSDRNVAKAAEIDIW